MLFGVKGMKSKYIIVVLSTFSLLLGCQPREPTANTDELLGVWKTCAPKYERCFFEITKNSIIFVNRAVSEICDVNTISKIETTHEEKKILCTIHYKGCEGQKYKFSFFYDPSECGAIRFKNQTHIKWVKADVQSITKLINSD